MKILTVGEIIWDVYPDKRCIGGAPLNFAAHAAMLGADVAMISAVGKDELGDSASEYIRSFGISDKYIKRNDSCTGICDVTVNGQGIPSYSVRRGVAYDSMTLTDSDISSVNGDGYDLFYFGTLIQRSDTSRETINKILSSCSFGDIICDVNLRPGCYSSESLLTCLTHATVLKLSDEEEHIFKELGIYGEDIKGNERIARELVRQFPNLKTVIITMGANGSFAYRAADSRCVTVPGKRVQVASTVGAGDSFAAAFCVSYLSGGTLEGAMADATELSAFVCTRTEAVPLK